MAEKTERCQTVVTKRLVGKTKTKHYLSNNNNREGLTVINLLGAYLFSRLALSS